MGPAGSHFLFELICNAECWLFMPHLLLWKRYKWQWLESVNRGWGPCVCVGVWGEAGGQEMKTMWLRVGSWSLKLPHEEEEKQCARCSRVITMRNMNQACVPWLLVCLEQMCLFFRQLNSKIAFHLLKYDKVGQNQRLRMCKKELENLNKSEVHWPQALS